MISDSSIAKQNLASIIALIFHAIGLTGMLFYNRELFSSLTPYNLLLSAGLIIYTQPEKNISFFLFVLICFITGFAVEYLGVNHQLLFGSYEYLPAMGPQWQNVPVIIGLNWFIIMYCCGVSVQMLLNFLWNKLKDDDQPYRSNVGFVAVILDSALLATFFDWVMEPIAVELHWWQWANGTIPVLNYISWLGVSVVLMTLFRLFSFNKQNKFAVNLLLIQFLFFLILRTVL